MVSFSLVLFLNYVYLTISRPLTVLEAIPVFRLVANDRDVQEIQLLQYIICQTNLLSSVWLKPTLFNVEVRCSTNCAMVVTYLLQMFCVGIMHTNVICQ